MTYKDRKKSNVYKSAEGYDLYASNYDRELSYLDSFENDALLTLLANIKAGKVLDLGAGTGRLIPALERCVAREKTGGRRDGGTGGEDGGKCASHIVAADLSEEMLKIAKKKFPRVETVIADANELPFDDGSFDLVVASFLIVHVRDLEVVFDEVHRVLKDGGIFILTNINQRKAPKLDLGGGEEIVIESYYHRPVDVTAALENSLFKIEKEETVFGRGVWINQIVKAVK